MALNPALLCGLVALAVYALRRLLSLAGYSRGLHYPPGPRGLPIFGNVRRLTGPSWEVYRKWSEEYGSDLILIKTLGTSTLIINSMKAAKDLLEKRSAIYSDRPSANITMLGELCGMDWGFGLQPYGAEWRDGRKAFQRVFNPNIVPIFRPTEIAEARKLLRRLLRTPEDFISHLRLMAGSTSISIAYGINTLEENDPYISHAEETMVAVNSTYPGAFLVDYFPLLKHVPEWLPGAGFKTKARIWRESVMWTLHVPWDLVKNNLNHDPLSVSESAAKTLIQDIVDPAKDKVYMERVARSAVASIYVAGSDTTLAVFETFLFTMILHPEIQRRAQEYLDKECQGRLPDFTDYDDLPYIHAILKECIRWHPVASLNVPHSNTEDDVYEGYFIKKGTTVIVNNWAILHDPDVYKDPDAFFPERYLKRSPDGTALISDPDAPDPMDVAFGFGRRICPGRFMAYESMWITIASMLAVFNIEKAKDANGEDITPPKRFAEVFASRPLPFPCRIVPRSAAHKARILDAES